MADPSLLVSIFTLGWAAGTGMSLCLLRQERTRPHPRGNYGLLYDWRTRLSHENHNAPQGAPPLLYRPRSSGSGEPNLPPRDL